MIASLSASTVFSRDEHERIAALCDRFVSKDTVEATMEELKNVENRVLTAPRRELVCNLIVTLE